VVDASAIEEANIKLVQLVGKPSFSVTAKIVVIRERTTFETFLCPPA
jgi:hypothetical protein